IDPVIICSEADAQRIQVALPDCRLNFAYLPAEATLAAQAIQAGDFDVLYYFEVATGTLNYFLPFCRLAPIQCASWGIQVTSGIPNVDYYISSRLIETEHAQERYSEKLLLL